MSDSEDKQWQVLIDGLKESGIPPSVVIEIMNALLSVSAKDGYGNINISIAGGMIQEFKVMKAKRITQEIENV